MASVAAMKFYTSELMPEMHGISGPVLAYPVAARPRYLVLLGKKPLTALVYFLVARGGIEPPTRGFSVRCSTN